MDERRMAPDLVTSDYEDRGLFHEKLSEKQVHLLPRMTRNGRGDLVIMGEVKRQIEVEVIFPGRRAQDAVPLLHKVRALAGKPPEEARLPIRVEGVMRPRFHRDPSGWETKSYQLIAARWMMFDDGGIAKVYGELPKTAPEVRRA